MSPLARLFYDKYKSLETSEHQLLYLFLEITRRCNLSCLHCGSDCRAQEQSRVLTRDAWFSVIDYVAARFSVQLVFVITGGEPLLSPHLAAIGRRIKDNKRMWGMVTNGMALDETVFNTLVEAGLSSITVSLDGLEATHNRLRGNPHAFERAVRALTIIGASGVPFRDAVTCVYPANLEQLDAMAQLLISLNIPAWRLFRIFPLGRAKNNNELLLDSEQSDRLINWIAANRERCRKAGLKIDFSCEGYLPWALDRKVRTEPFFCRAGVSIASVLCDGTITGCSNNGPDFYEGNFFKDDFKTVWETGFKKFRDRSWTKTGPCAVCRDYRHCRGGSIHLWDTETKSPAFCYLHEGSD